MFLRFLRRWECGHQINRFQFAPPFSKRNNCAPSSAGTDAAGVCFGAAGGVISYPDSDPDRVDTRRVRAFGGVTLTTSTAIRSAKNSLNAFAALGDCVFRGDVVFFKTHHPFHTLELMNCVREYCGVSIVAKYSTNHETTTPLHIHAAGRRNRKRPMPHRRRLEYLHLNKDQTQSQRIDTHRIFLRFLDTPQRKYLPSNYACPSDRLRYTKRCDTKNILWV